MMNSICFDAGVKDFRLHVSRQNQGVGATRSMLIKEAMKYCHKDDLLFCLDDDVYLQKNAIKNMVKALDREPSCGIMGVIGSLRNFCHHKTKDGKTVSYGQLRKPVECGVFGVAYGIRAVLPMRDNVNFSREMRARADAKLEVEACLAGWKCMVNPLSDATHVRSIKNHVGAGSGNGGLSELTQKRWLEYGKLIVDRYPEVCSMDKLNRLHYLRKIKKMRETGEIVLKDIRRIK